MSRRLFWSRQWQSWTRTWTRRPRARHRTAPRLEALERRLNLAAVLVVETVDAYWLIEEPTFDSLAPSASADELWGGELSGSAGFDEIGLALPEAVSPTNSNGEPLNATEAKLTESLLADLYYSEPDFFYEDVLAITFFNDTSMDVLIDSGLFDGGDATDSFSNSDLFASEFFDNSEFAINLDETTPSDQQADLVEPSNSADESVEPENETVLKLNDLAKAAENSDVFAAAKAEVASWSKRLELEPLVKANTRQSIAEEAWAAVIAQPRSLAASPDATETLPQSSRGESLRDSVFLTSVVAKSVPEETIAVREVTKLESFFAKFPLLSFGDGRASVLRLGRDSGDDHAAKASDGDDPVAPDASSSLSYSQWASLFGVLSLCGASLWQNRSSDGRGTQTTPFESKNNGKRPVAC